MINPPPALTSPRPAAAASGPKTDEAPGSAARKAAAAVRLAEQAFLRDAQRVFLLPVAALAQHTRGATVVYRDGLGPLLKNGKLPAALAYAVISVRRNGEKSPLSNIVVLAPDVPPGPPVLLAVTAEEGRVCLEWLPPAADMLGRPVEVGGYFVYRRLLPEEEYEAALNSKPSTGTAYVDAGAPQGQLVYTVRAILPNKPKVEGAPADEAPVDYRDIFPPPPPARLDALPEAGLVRLVWDPVTVPDLAGYVAAFHNLAAAGSTLITEDLAFDDEPAFQQGLGAATAETLARNGIWVSSSAGNLGAKHAHRGPAIGTGTTPDGVTGSFANCPSAPAIASTR